MQIGNDEYRHINRLYSDINNAPCRRGLKHVRMEKMKTILPCMACGKLRIVNGRPEKFIAYHWECSYGKGDCSDPEKIAPDMFPFKIYGPVAVDPNHMVGAKLT